MSNEQYEKWDRFNVEKEAEKVEENSKVDDRDIKLAKLEKHNAEVESSVLKEDEDASESLISKSRVEEFRKVKKGRRKRGAAGVAGKKMANDVPSDNAPAAVSPGTGVQGDSVDIEANSCLDKGEESEPALMTKPNPASTAADSYLAKAEAVKRRAECLKEARDSRSQGKGLAKEQDFQKALDTFQRGLQNLNEYEALLDDPEGKKIPEDAPEGVPEAPKKSKSHAVCCGQDPKQLKEQQLLLNPGNLKTTKENIGVTLRRDFQLNIGRCYLELGKSSEAAECFKYVLLVDGGNANAWVARAECFRRMELYSLAELHLVKAVEIDEVDRNAKAVKKMNDQDLILKKTQEILGDVDGGENDPVMLEVNSRKPVKEILHKCVEMYKQGNVIFREQFFNSAREKYEKAAYCATAAEKIANRSAQTFLPEAINQIRVASHLQASACNLLRKRDFCVAEEHCTKALKAGGFNIMALLRRSEARMELGKFNAAINDLLKVEKKLKGGLSGETGIAAWASLQKRLAKARYIKNQLGQLSKENKRDDIVL